MNLTLSQALNLNPILTSTLTLTRTPFSLFQSRSGEIELELPSEQLGASRLDAKADLRLHATSFNTFNSRWEPVLEPWTLRCEVVHIPSLPFTLTLTPNPYPQLAPSRSP